MCIRDSIRPDITYAVKELARWLTAPTTRSWNQLKHLMRYLKGTLHYKSFIKPIEKLANCAATLDLQVYVDSDWAGCSTTRKSTSGVIITILGTCILAISRTQSTLALSSGEAEMYAIGTGSNEALYLRNFLLEARLCQALNVVIHTDSTAGKAMSSRFGTSRKTRHVQLRYLFMQDLVKDGVIMLRKVLGTENPADVCTKHVTQDTLLRHLWKLGIADTYDTIASLLRLPKTLSLGPAAGW